MKVFEVGIGDGLSLARALHSTLLAAQRFASHPQWEGDANAIHILIASGFSAPLIRRRSRCRRCNWKCGRDRLIDVDDEVCAMSVFLLLRYLGFA